MKLSVNISGSMAIQANLKKFEDELNIEVQKATKIKSQEIVAMAKRKAPKDMGTLAQSISSNENTPYHYTVTAKAFYAAYMEFGTGKNVKVPQEWSDIALEFKGKGKGDFDEGLKRITAWCKRKGIDEDLAYVIFMAILKKGLEPKPFMYPAFLHGRLTFKKDLKFMVDKLIAKYNG